MKTPEIVSAASITRAPRANSSPWPALLATVAVGQAIEVDEIQVQAAKLQANKLGLPFSRVTAADGKVYLVRLETAPVRKARAPKVTVTETEISPA